MSIPPPAKKADITAVVDRNEPLSSIEPMLISQDSQHRQALTDLAIDLAARAAGFRRSLPDGVRTALADLVRSMNCYYSNLIEGHDTHPVDIERALKNDYSHDPQKRDLQLEAKAHIAVQQWVDSGGVVGRTNSIGVICDIHRRFCELLPEGLLWVENPDTGKRLKVTPGELRQLDVKVGQHVAVSPGAVPRFLAHLEQALGRLGKTDAILSTAAMHHRLLWIHPFLDGNGRVARLISHASLLDTLETGGVWSVARGLARSSATYKAHLANCDMQRRNDLDGRGNLSEEALAQFTRFFLETCIDQVNFMEQLVEPNRLLTRIRLWAEEETHLGILPAKAATILEAVLYRGALPRADIASIVGTGERQARRVVAALLDRGVLRTESARAPLNLAFPAVLASRWMPGLFPEQQQ